MGPRILEKERRGAVLGRGDPPWYALETGQKARVTQSWVDASYPDGLRWWTVHEWGHEYTKKNAGALSWVGVIRRGTRWKPLKK